MPGVSLRRPRARSCARSAAVLAGAAASSSLLAHPQPGDGGALVAGLAAAALAAVAVASTPVATGRARRFVAVPGVAAGAATATLALVPLACAALVLGARRRDGAGRLTWLDGLIAALGATALASVRAPSSPVPFGPLEGSAAAAFAIAVVAAVGLLAGVSSHLERPLRLLASALPFAAGAGALGVLAAQERHALPAVAVAAAVATLALGLVRAAGAFLELRGLAAARDQARTDELTGLPNRRALAEAAARALADRDPARPLAVLLLDLDGFKQVNDDLGHHLGDELLRAAAGRIGAAVRPDDLPARLGGDEFAVLLEAGTPAADVIAARIRGQLARPFAIREHLLAVDASVGTASWPQDGDDLHALLRCADAAMYAAKRARRQDLSSRCT
jgi:diguanylate cyclase (GGDEF)-like protein